MERVQENCLSDFKTFLGNELARRSSANPNYSLRAFARDLGVDSSFLSKLLSGKRSMTARTILTLAPRLELSETEVQGYLQKAGGRPQRNSSRNFRNQMLREIENQKLIQTMEWYHLAILELVGVPTFQANAPWISERLSISESQAQAALDDLIGSAALSQGEDGQWKSEVGNHFVCGKKNPRVSWVKSQIFEQAMAMLKKQIGNHSTMTMLISESRLAEAQERIAKFRKELSLILSEPEDKNQVYQVAISLFPISK